MLSINLAWTRPGLTDTEILEQYKEWLRTCYDNEIKLVRVFIVRWSINALYDRRKHKLLLDILNYANLLEIQVILVVNNYTDFITDHYKDFYDNKFTWKTYPLKNGKPKKFFNKISKKYLGHIHELLSVVSEANNLFAIEIMNEIDQADVDKRRALKWTVSIGKEIDKITNNKYKLMVSFSDESWFKYFNQTLPRSSKIETTIHNYAYPSRLFSRNLERLTRKFGTNVLVSEYGYNSHEPDIKSVDVLRYFCSGLWFSRVVADQTSTLSWWWEDILKNDLYIQTISKINKLSPLGEIRINEAKDVMISTKKDRHKKRRNDGKKIYYRLKEIMKRPSRLLKEGAAIKKIIGKYLYGIARNNDYAVYEITSGKKRVFFLENSCDVIIKIPNNNRLEEKIARSLTTGKTNSMIGVGSNLESQNLKPGCYIIS